MLYGMRSARAIAGLGALTMIGCAPDKPDTGAGGDCQALQGLTGATGAAGPAGRGLEQSHLYRAEHAHTVTVTPSVSCPSGCSMVPSQVADMSATARCDEEDIALVGGCMPTTRAIWPTFPIVANQHAERVVSLDEQDPEDRNIPGGWTCSEKVGAQLPPGDSDELTLVAYAFCADLPPYR